MGSVDGMTEGIRGNEHEDNTSWHTTMLPFTRFMSGPADHTFCFEGHPIGVNPKVSKVMQSKEHQMALSVIYFSPRPARLSIRAVAIVEDANGQPLIIPKRTFITPNMSFVQRPKMLFQFIL